jgi:hypothetical protein
VWVESRLSMNQEHAIAVSPSTLKGNVAPSDRTWSPRKEEEWSEVGCAPSEVLSSLHCPLTNRAWVVTSVVLHRPSASKKEYHHIPTNPVFAAIESKLGYRVSGHI